MYENVWGLMFMNFIDRFMSENYLWAKCSVRNKTHALKTSSKIDVPELIYSLSSLSQRLWGQGALSSILFWTGCVQLNFDGSEFPPVWDERTGQKSPFFPENLSDVWAAHMEPLLISYLWCLFYLAKVSNNSVCFINGPLLYCVDTWVDSEQTMSKWLSLNIKEQTAKPSRELCLSAKSQLSAEWWPGREAPGQMLMCELLNL